MRARGITYDTGFLPGNGSRPSFTPDIVRTDMAVIANQLHCDAVRITGGDSQRLKIAATHAAEAGLEVWFSPMPVDLPEDRLLPFFGECAQLAAHIPGEVVFVTGCEMSAFCRGFIPGATYTERLQAMGSADMDWWISLGPVLHRLNDTLAQVAATVRTHFTGRVTYAAGPWEQIDWSPFDLVGIDAYRAAYNKDTFRDELKQHFTHGKPVAVTEFGTCAYTGAGDRGGMAWTVPDGAVRDEQEQVRYFTELMEIFEADGVDTAFWFTFASYARTGADDLGSYGVVHVTDEAQWTPKQVFHALAAAYAQ
ncbi:hypothetical protein LWC34_14390 [Kibdelosporangium philippinense]|uniref:Abortive infection protein n=1 Tax=Kibdelosporangium philippinense TaxID=211113 RepID=A0ABS8Z855_9PSEU|nr:hypothetical protein [Kibdelosporangium philippinense]MCE7004010.1 hypothetical protein [Kibdelosporangium philippinense]